MDANLDTMLNYKASSTGVTPFQAVHIDALQRRVQIEMRAGPYLTKAIGGSHKAKPLKATVLSLAHLHHDASVGEAAGAVLRTYCDKHAALDRNGIKS